MSVLVYLHQEMAAGQEQQSGCHAVDEVLGIYHSLDLVESCRSLMHTQK